MDGIERRDSSEEGETKQNHFRTKLIPVVVVVVVFLFPQIYT